MRPKSGSIFASVVAIIVQLFFQNLLCDETWTRQTINSFPHIHIHITITGDFFAELVLLNYISQKIFHFEADVFVSQRWSVEVHFFNIQRHKLDICGWKEIFEK